MIAKKSILCMVIKVFILLIACNLIACSFQEVQITSDNDQQSTVISVIVSPATATVATGQTQQFAAEVNGTNNPANTVTWMVEGGGNGTGISTSGLLTVAANETSSRLTVRATSTVDTNLAPGQ